MSDAEATLMSAIIAGLSRRAHITGASAIHAGIQAADILDELFHRSVAWAVQEYLAEKGWYEADSLGKQMDGSNEAQGD